MITKLLKIILNCLSKYLTVNMIHTGHRIFSEEIDEFMYSNKKSCIPCLQIKDDPTSLENQLWMMLLHLGSLLDGAIELSIHKYRERIQCFLWMWTSACSAVLVAKDFVVSRVKISEAVEIHDTLPDRLSSWYWRENFFQAFAFHVYNMKIICCT